MRNRKKLKEMRFLNKKRKKDEKAGIMRPDANKSNRADS